MGARNTLVAAESDAAYWVLMRSHSQETLRRVDPAGDCRSRISRLAGVLRAILFLGLLHLSDQAYSLTLPGSYCVTLAWESSPSPEVIGYRIYYGAASGDYTNSIVVDNVPTHTVSGLASGVTYFFAVTAYDANDVESSFSNEISFGPGLPGIKIVVAATGEVVLTLKGLNGHTYEVEATEDFTTWTVIATLTLWVNDSLDFTDRSAASFPQRFYRTRVLNL